LARYREEGDNFLQQIVTGDETWIHHYEPESKRKNTQWQHPLSPVAKKFKMQPSAGKLMLTVFWESQGPVLETYQERGTNITSATYCDMLQRDLKPAIRSKRRGKLSKESLLLNDNARPPPHCSPHIGDPQTTEVGGYGNPSLQFGFSAI